MLRLLTDFNEIEDGDRVTGLAETVPGADVGDRVLLHDDGAHEAFGTIESIANGLVTAKLDWATWGPPRTIAVDATTVTWVVSGLSAMTVEENTSEAVVEFPDHGPRVPA
jgi:hypothetical protein